MKAVILAAGLGTRLGSITENIPKCLLKINGRTLLENQIELLDSFGIKEHYAVIGTKGPCWSQESYEEVKSITDNLILNFNNDKTYNTYSIYLALKMIDADDVLLIDGDLYLTQAFFRRALIFSGENYMVTKLADNRAEAGTKVITNDNGHITKLGKTLIINKFPWDIHSGLFKISKSDFNLFFSIIEQTSYHDREIEAPLQVFCEETILSVNRISCNHWVNVNTSADVERAKGI
jgi:1L-myo-inositol 1-phosphate cytidylyltransferase / CDP-L-myo-inositol myo-inositolphosphotransferase